MNLISKNKYILILIFIIIISFCCLPIWYFQYYLNQDGTSHLYNSFILLELLQGNKTFTDLYSINPYLIPNLTGHWIMTLLMFVFPPLIVSKLIITFTFAGVVASCIWLRWQTSGNDELAISLLFGTVFAFNWMWFLGFYNFIIGFIGYTFTLGLFWKWKDTLNFKKVILLSLLILFVYFSHLISFGMLLGSILLISICSTDDNKVKNFILTTAAFIPTIPAIISYRSVSITGGKIFPVWYYLENPLSISDWILQLQSADPFQLISRKAFPFVSNDSLLFAVFSSFLWCFLMIFIILLLTFYINRNKELNLQQNLPWLMIFLSSIVFWVVAPDDFGKSHGSFLRERVLVCGLVCFLPLFDIKRFSQFKIIIKLILLSIIIFQTLVLWEYSIEVNKNAENYIAAKPYINENDKFASIVLIDNACRYKPNPISNVNTILGIGKNTLVWDNYELGYYLFPVIVNNKEDQYFIYEYRESNAINLCESSENISKKLNSLKTIFEHNNEKISVLLVWNEDKRVTDIISKWFETEPFYINEKIRLYKHK